MCTHHWMLEAPKSPYTTGTCKLCGATKEFQHQWELQDENWAPRLHSKDIDLTVRYVQALEMIGYRF